MNIPRDTHWVTLIYIKNVVLRALGKLRFVCLTEGPSHPAPLRHALASALSYLLTSRSRRKQGGYIVKIDVKPC